MVGDSNGLERWLNARLLRRDDRPGPLDEGVIRRDGSFRCLSADDDGERTVPCIQPIWSGKGSSQDWIIPLLQKLVAEGKSVIVLRNVRGATVGCATYLANALGLPPAQETIDALPAGDLSVSSTALRRALAGGVAFHNSDLDRVGNAGSAGCSRRESPPACCGSAPAICTRRRCARRKQPRACYG